MGLFGKSKKEREKEYMNRLDVPLCLKEDFELIIDDVFTIMGVGTVATGNISTGMCREGENACVYKTNGGVLGDIFIYTSADEEKGVLLELKGRGCRQFESYLLAQQRSWYDFLMDALIDGGVMKRIDLAINDHTGILDIPDRKSTRLNSSHDQRSRMPSSA